MRQRVLWIGLVASTLGFAVAYQEDHGETAEAR
jgi:hypothetical protein